MSDKLKIILMEYINALNKILEVEKKTQKIKITRECRICGGHGTNPDKPHEVCRTCNGKGEFTVTINVNKIKFIN